jgi:hypothetical protein
MFDKLQSFFAVKDNTYKLIRDIVIIEIGLMISSFGTALFYSAELGSPPMATLCDGLHLLLNISYGSAYTLANAALLVVLFFIERSYLEIGTFLCVFTIGPWVNLFTPLLQSTSIITSPLWTRILCTICGTAFMGIGLGLYVSVNRGFGALEGLVKFFCEKTGITTSHAKIFQDALLITGGVLLQATWGVGTFITVFLTGPAMQWSIQFFSKYLRRIDFTN